MNANKGLSWIPTTWLFLVTIFLAVAMVSFLAAPAFADDQQEMIRHKQDTTQLVEKARFTLDSFMADKNMDAFRDLIKQAKGVLIVP